MTTRDGLFVYLAIASFCVSPARCGDSERVADMETATCALGRRGGRIVVAERAEPKTLNPVLAMDAPSRNVIRRMNADLIVLNRATQRAEAGVAKTWTASRDGRHIVIELRRGLLFSDGAPFDADDVLFSFQVFLDPKVQSPQRDLLVIGGKPITVRKLGRYTVGVDLSTSYSATDRLFDSISILPRHLLEQAYRDGKIAQAWNITTEPAKIAGLGPFRLKQYRPGEKIVLERNPYYWKVDREGTRLPYLDEIEFQFVSSEDAQIMRFLAGETDLLNRVSAKNYSALAQAGRHPSQVEDLGPGLEYNFLFFNLNSINQAQAPGLAAKQSWFQQIAFRRAISAAIDRESIVRLVYGGRATPIWWQVSPGNAAWFNRDLPKPPRSIERARELLGAAGFSYRDGVLFDHAGRKVEFSIITSAGNEERLSIATIIQDDLKQLGMEVHVVSLEFRALLDRVLNSHNYEACVLGLGGGDGDPNSEMNVWLSNGGTHVWNPNQRAPASGWEAEMDELMRRQLITADQSARKRMYDRVQQIVAENLPVICVAAPHLVVAARRSLGNFRPAILDHYTLWNAEELFVRGDGSRPE